MSEETTEIESAEIVPEEDTQDDTAAPEETPTDQTDEAEEAFPREVVEKLRKENAGYRQRAQRADAYAQRLHLEVVRATGKLADPTDLPFNEDHLDDPEALAAAIDDLLERKPHLASRRPVGDIGQGRRGSASESFSLLGLLKERT